MENCSIDRFTHPQGCFLFFEPISRKNTNNTPKNQKKALK